MNKFSHKRIEAMEHYIASDPSDPFTRARVYSHHRFGITGYNNTGQDAFYEASVRVEVDANNNPHKVYYNVRRP